MKKQKRRLMIVNKIQVESIMEIAEAHTAALLILNHIKAPAEAQPYLDKAISLFGHTLVDLHKQYESAAGKELSTQHVLTAFEGPGDVKAEAVTD